MLTCVHHVMWVRPIAGGLHQCILCFQVVTRKDVYPKLEDLPPEFTKRWEAHERTAPPPEQPAAPAKVAAPKPPPPAKTAAERPAQPDKAPPAGNPEQPATPERAAPPEGTAPGVRS